MSKSSRGKDYLRERASEINSLTNIVAEHDKSLAEYYVGREFYVDRALNFDDHATFFVGPKGIGKSAVLQMVRLLRESETTRIIEIAPDDLAFQSLANAQASTPLLLEGGKYQWMFKSLWDYVLTVEVLRHEIPATGLGYILDKLFGVFRGESEKAARRLVGMTFTDEGHPKTLTDKMLDLINEIELSAGGTPGHVGARIELGPNPGEGRELQILNLVNKVAKHLGELLSRRYYLLVDDLDLHWNGTDIQNWFIAALFYSLRRMDRNKIKCVVAIREQIFRELPLEDRDKFRAGVCSVNWDQVTVKKIVQMRLARVLRHNESEIWTGLFYQDVFEQLWQHSTGTPRDLLRLTHACLNEAQKRGAKYVGEHDVTSGIRQFSLQRLDDLESEWAFKWRGLGHLARRFRGWPKEFSLERIQELLIEIGCDFENGRVEAERYTWVRGFVEDPKAFAELLLTCGFLMHKLSRTDAPRVFDPSGGDRVSNASYFAIHPMYWLGLGIVGA
ncbi:MAG: hypothetical protein ABR964_13435 [Tepidisphaeraceae bacterium]